MQSKMAASKAGVVLKSVKKIAVRFCPFESNVRSTREFLRAVTANKARTTNMNCETVTDVRHDKSEPLIDITFDDGERLVMKGSYLTYREMITAFNAKCTTKELEAKEKAKK